MANTQIVYIDAPIFVYQTNLISEFSGNTIGTFIAGDSGSVSSVIRFSEDTNLDRFITYTLTNTNVVSNDAQINPVLIIPSITSTLTFGDEDQFKLNLFIVDQGVAAATTFGTANVFISLGPVSIESTATFGVPNRQNPVHRSLIYKSDNITKLGAEDDVEIASGIVVQSSTAKLTGNTVPGTAAGFITVTIDGTDYRMPFFSIPE